MSLRSLIILLVAVLLALPAAAKERTWTSADGRTMKAEFVREVDGLVTFLKEGKLVSIPLEKLSEKDQQIVRDLVLGKPLPDEDAPAPDAASPPAGATSPGSSDPQAGSTPDAPKITIEVRTWTDNRGQKTNAKFVRTNGNDVVLNRSGKIITVSFHSLSEEDQQYVRDLLTQQGKEELIPAAQVAPPTGAATPGAVAGPVTTGIPGSPFPPSRGGIGPRGPGGMRGPGGGMRGPGMAGTPGLGPGIGPPGAVPPGVPAGSGAGMAGTPGLGPGIGPPGAVPPGVPAGSGFRGANPGVGSRPDPPVIPTTPPTVASAPPGTNPGGMSGPGLSSGGMPSGIGTTPGYGRGRGSSIPTSFPPESRFPNSPAPTFPSGPTFQQVFKCSGCQREISQEQSKLDRCPYCRTVWVYKEDGSGNKQMTAGGVRNVVIGAIVGIVVVVLGGVAGFIGIIVAIVRAVSRPSRNSNAYYRRY